jgi:hypothetical protein
MSNKFLGLDSVNVLVDYINKHCTGNTQILDNISQELSTKADIADTYTKTEVNKEINNIINSIIFSRELIDDVDSLVIKNADSTIIGSIPVADFVVDGMLENVAIKEGEEHILVFTWNTSAGEKIIEIDFSKYVDSYNADGKTLEMVIIDGIKTFGVKDNVFEKVGTAAALIDNIEIASEEQILDLFNTTDETLN